MKMIKLAALHAMLLSAVLASAACSKKAPDCDAAIAKGIDSYLTAMKSQMPNPQIVDAMGAKFKEAFTERCKADKWSAEVVTCFATVATAMDLKTCQQKLTGDQQAKLQSELREAGTRMRGSMGGGPHMPAGMPGHPAALSGGSGAPAAPGPGAPPAPGGAAAAPTGSTPPPAAAPTPALAPGSPAAPAPSGSGAK